jgi:hypothetical protein
VIDFRQFADFRVRGFMTQRIRPLMIADALPCWRCAVGSDTSGERAAIFYKLIRTAKLNVFEPNAHPRDVLGRISKAPV